MAPSCVQVFSKGMESGTENLKGIDVMAPQTTYTEVRRFIGATEIFCHFIKSFAKLLEQPAWGWEQ